MKTPQSKKVFKIKPLQRVPKSRRELQIQISNIDIQGQKLERSVSNADNLKRLNNNLKLAL